tara:strand:+ start:2980 stop:3399 length:420 start_codon:yes stop_codon:yes gene_type:complete
MLSINLLFLAFQVNSWFRLSDLEHIIEPRRKHLVASYDNDKFKGYTGVITPTKIPKYVIAASERKRMHFFLHDKERFRCCLWDGEVSYDDKKDIVTSAVKWLNQTERIDYLLHNEEDGLVFSEVLQKLNISYVGWMDEV